MALTINVNFAQVSLLHEELKNVNSAVTKLKANLNSLPSKNITKINKNLATTNKLLGNVAVQSKVAGKALEGGTRVGNENLNTLSKNLDESVKKFRAFGRRMDYVGSKLLPISYGLGVITAGAITAGASFENAFQDVVKTLDAPQITLDALRKSIRNLSNEIPVSANELSKLTSIGAQLGLPAESLMKFTDTVARLGVATNITSEEAGLVVTQFTNVMQASDKLGKKLSKGMYIERVGNTLVQLGNTTSTTEDAIMQMSRRLSGVASVMKLTGAETLGWSASMASLGIAAQQGGSALGRVMMKFNAFVSEGGGGLTKLAKLSGMSAKEFQKSWGEDVSGTMQILLQNLNKLSKNDLQKVLNDLGVKNTQDVQVMLKLAKGIKTVDNALFQANKGWTENNALLKESEKRFQTTINKLKKGFNTFVNVGIDIFDKLKPAIDGTIEGLTVWAENFSKTIKNMNPSTLEAITKTLLRLALLGPVMKLANIPIQMVAGSISMLAKSKAKLGTIKGGLVAGMLAKDLATLPQADKWYERTARKIGNIIGTIKTGGKLPLTTALGLGGGAVAAGVVGITLLSKAYSELYKKNYKNTIKLRDSLAGISKTLKLSDEGIQSYKTFSDTLQDTISNIEMFKFGVSGITIKDLSLNISTNAPQVKEQFNTYVQDVIKSQSNLTQAQKYLTAKEVADYKKEIADKYSGTQKEADKIFNEIEKIQTNASKKGRKLTVDEINKIQSKYKKLEELVQNLDLTPKTPKINPSSWGILTEQQQNDLLENARKNLSTAMQEASNFESQGKLKQSLEIQKKAFKEYADFLISTGEVSRAEIDKINKSFAAGGTGEGTGVAGDMVNQYIEVMKYLKLAQQTYNGKFLTDQAIFINQSKAQGFDLSAEQVKNIQDMYNKMGATAQKKTGDLSVILRKGLQKGLTGNKLYEYIANELEKISGLKAPKIDTKDTEESVKTVGAKFKEIQKSVKDVYLEPNAFVQDANAMMKRYNETIEKFKAPKVKDPDMPNGYSLGKNTMESIQAGMSTVDLKASVKVVVNEITGTYAKYLEINSPSKVMTKLGYWTGLGVAVGIKNSTPKVISAVKNLATTVKTQADQQFKKFAVSSSIIPNTFGVTNAKQGLKGLVTMLKGYVATITKALSAAQFQTAVNTNQTKITKGILEQMLLDPNLTKEEKEKVKKQLEEINDDMEMEQDRSQEIANNQTQHDNQEANNNDFYDRMEDRLKKNTDFTKAEEERMGKYLNKTQKQELHNAIADFNKYNKKTNLTKKQKEKLNDARKLIEQYNKDYIDQAKIVNDQNRELDEQGINDKYNALQQAEDMYKEMGYETDYSNGKINVTGKTVGGSVTNNNIVQNIEINGTNLTSQELIAMMLRYKKVMG